MSIVEKIKKIKNLDKNPNGGANEEQIERAEKRLSLRFSKEYKEYVKEFKLLTEMVTTGASNDVVRDQAKKVLELGKQIISELEDAGISC